MQDKVKIGYRTYVIKEDGIADKSENWGDIIHKTGEIHIEESLSLQHKQEILLHEIIHGIGAICMNDELIEKQISSLAYAFAMVIRDNPQMFMDIIKGLK